MISIAEDGTKVHLVRQVWAAAPYDAPDMKQELIPSCFAHCNSPLLVEPGATRSL